MTIQESIKGIKSIRDYLTAGNPIWDVKEIADVCDTAIRSLEAWVRLRPQVKALTGEWPPRMDDYEEGRIVGHYEVARCVEQYIWEIEKGGSK